MEERSMTELMQVASGFYPKHKLKSEVKKIAKANVERLPQELPLELHAPDENELETMRQWMLDYKNNNPKASKREIRRAVQQNFGVKIYRQPYKKKII